MKRKIVSLLVGLSLIFSVSVADTTTEFSDFDTEELTLFKKDFKWVSSSIQIKDKNYMTSIFTKGINVCSNNK